MRSIVCLLCSGLLGCAFASSQTGGETKAKYGGNMSLVFTNATPDKMCELHMSFEDDDKFGDNWLPAGGLASGQSLEFKVRAGKYKATWNTCKSGGSDKPYYAGTLIGDTAFMVNEQTQLFTYVADSVAPTKRAPPRDFYTMVKFSGQPIGGKQDMMATAPPPPVQVAPVQEPEPQLDVKASSRSSIKGKPAKGGKLGAKAKPSKGATAKIEAKKATGDTASDVAPANERFSARDWVDTKAPRTKKKSTIKPSLGRSHDLANSKVNYKNRTK